jgi:hypothetical protein
VHSDDDYDDYNLSNCKYIHSFRVIILMYVNG